MLYRASCYVVVFKQKNNNKKQHLSDYWKIFVVFKQKNNKKQHLSDYWKFLCKDHKLIEEVAQSKLEHWRAPGPVDVLESSRSCGCAGVLESFSTPTGPANTGGFSDFYNSNNFRQVYVQVYYYNSVLAKQCLFC